MKCPLVDYTCESPDSETAVFTDFQGTQYACLVCRQTSARFIVMSAADFAAWAKKLEAAEAQKRRILVDQGLEYGADPTALLDRLGID
jgi:hypothetical protein